MYCTPQDLIDRFTADELLRLTDRDGLGIINDTTVNQAITDASAEIDTYLGRYQLPLATVPAVIVGKCCDMVRYLLNSDDVSEQVEKRYNNAIKYFTKVSNGTVSLGLNPAGGKPATGITALVQSAGRIFGRSSKW